VGVVDWKWRETGTPRFDDDDDYGDGDRLCDETVSLVLAVLLVDLLLLNSSELISLLLINQSSVLQHERILRLLLLLRYYAGRFLVQSGLVYYYFVVFLALNQNIRFYRLRPRAYILQCSNEFFDFFRHAVKLNSAHTPTPLDCLVWKVQAMCYIVRYASLDSALKQEKDLVPIIWMQEPSIPLERWGREWGRRIIEDLMHRHGPPHLLRAARVSPFPHLQILPQLCRYPSPAVARHERRALGIPLFRAAASLEM